MSDERFVFVHVQNGQDPKAHAPKMRTQIRRQAMRTIGPERRKPRKNPTFELSLFNQPLQADSAPLHGESISSLDSFVLPISARRATIMRLEQDNPGEEAEHGGQSLPLPVLDPGSGRKNPFIRYPTDMTEHMHILMEHAHFFARRALCIFHELWLSIALEDSAAFHQILSNTSYHLLTSGRDPTFKLVETAHQAAAFHIVKKRLQNPTLGDTISLIRSIIALATRANIDGNLEAWKMHMTAIQRITQLAGSQSSDSLPPNVACMLFWIDVTGALNGDVLPYFPIPQILQSSDLTDPKTELSGWLDRLPIIVNEGDNSRAEERLINTLKRVKRLNYYIDSRHNEHGSLAGSQAIGLALMRILHDLLMLRPMSQECRDDRADYWELIRLAAILSLAPIRRVLLGFHVRSETMTAQVHRLLFSQPQVDNDMFLAQLRLWVVMTTLAETTIESEKAFFIWEIRDVAGILQIQTWEDAENYLLGGIMWCRSVHSPVAKALWATFWRELCPDQLTVSLSPDTET